MINEQQFITLVRNWLIVWYGNTYDASTGSYHNMAAKDLLDALNDKLKGNEL